MNGKGNLDPQKFLIANAAVYLKQRLAEVTETPALDAQVLLSQIIQKPRAWILAHPEESLSPQQAQAVVDAADRLESGEALPYVLGHWEFYGLDFLVTAGTLIPRPETELLVDEAIRWLSAHPGRRKAADIGTGTGCIAIVLAKHFPNLQLLAVDVSGAALHTAAANAARHGVTSRVGFIQSDLLSAVSGQFDVLCANLPYIPAEKLPSLEVYRREPTLALDGGPDGLELIRRLLLLAPERMAAGGLLLIEIEASQGEEARRLSKSAFPSAMIQVLPDLAGHDRLVRVELP